MQAVAAIECGELSAESLARACLDRIAARNPAVQAFISVDSQQAIEQARQVDRGSGGLLRGLPFAVKDIIDTADHATSYGSSIHAGRRPAMDAACVAMAQAQSAVLLGKTVTSEFATQTPGPTRNPLDLACTPGGSSSGSAAAVADAMVPVAFGTQTTGSIVRPAAYCGVVGYKPSFGWIPAAGVKTLSPSNDTIGVLTRSVADAALFSGGLHGNRHLRHTASRPRISVCTSSQWSHLSAPTSQAIEQYARALERAGAVIGRIALPAQLEDAIAAQSRIVAWEARYSLAAERLRHAPRLSERLHARLEEEAATEVGEYMALLKHAASARLLAAELFADTDALLYPAAEGEAERGLENSGSPRFGGLWTLAHLPCVALPIGRGPAGLPLGVQLIGSHGDDERLLHIAQFAEDASEFEPEIAP
jgi:Asp-tRNA(Asn)/Glu-tRNA(Gln) amidotransferase A subunit family amidase